ncbi:MAG: hypothetical protein HOC74_23685 [Gemmatimonadetes bacterium]|jgi:hypothetical protein|nr:hypothetical protein [Gemmatimonadota bacterium]
MKKATLLALAFALVFAAAAHGRDDGRGMVASTPPIEPSSLFAIPTGRVVRSLDLAVSASGILFGEESSSGLADVVLGLGDIAEMEMGTISMSSSLKGPSQLVSVPGGGLKVYLPLWKYVHGVGASFRRSGSYEVKTPGASYEAKLGEFYAVTSIANFTPGQETSSRAGWKGVKFKSHLGFSYTDASLGVDQVDRKRNFWRPIGGFEAWKEDSRARIIGELSWNADFKPEDGGRIEDIRVVTGGVRFFFSKHVTFDVGVRHQDNYGGLSESTIQTKLHFSIPTHTLRERVVGN